MNKGSTPTFMNSISASLMDTVRPVSFPRELRLKIANKLEKSEYVTNMSEYV